MLKQSATPTATADSSVRQELVTSGLVLIEPLSDETANLQSVVTKVAEITGLDPYTTRQRLVGSALDILIKDSDQSRLRQVCDSVRACGVRAAAVSGQRILEPVQSARAVKIERSGSTTNSLRFIDQNENTILTLDGDSEAIVLLGALSPELYGVNKSLLRAVYGSSETKEDALRSRLEEISRGRPALAIWTVGSDDANNSDNIVYLDGGAFNYQSLGEDATLSVAQNFQFLVSLISKASSCSISAGFGVKVLPLASLASKPKDHSDTLRLFLRYAHIVQLAASDGLYQVQDSAPNADTANITPIRQTATVVAGIAALTPGIRDALAEHAAIGGSLNDPRGKTLPAKRSGDHENSTPNTLPQPPMSARRYRGGGLRSLLSPMRSLQHLAPPWLSATTILATAALWGTIQMTEGALASGWIMIPSALALLTISYTLSKRKRTIENLPTSRIRSMPMGTVEIKGRAKRKYHLKAPHSQVDCVYYRYRTLVKRRAPSADYRKNEYWTVVERGESGPVPFYLEDNTGLVLIDPNGAVISSGETHEYTGGLAEMMMGVKSNSDRRTIETLIPEGAELYVIGHARPLRNSATERQNELRRRLSALKNDPRLLELYDADDDGSISFEEWAVAREDVDRQLMMESLTSGGSGDSVAVGKSPQGGVFLISDKAETTIIATYKWVIPLSGLGGLAMLAYTISNLIG